MACHYKSVVNPLNPFSSTKGLTLIELMMVMAILVLLIGASLPLSINFYKTRQFDVHLKGVVQTLRRAQLKSMVTENDSSFGVYLGSNQYVLFKGNSYLARDVAYDEAFELPDNLQITGLSEIVFSKLKGTPSDTGTITLTIDNQSETININEVGRIDY
ncbi:MAG: Tfp pilus assembly protein FimT/FimU [Candidatus Aminicenantia bacterium]